MSISCVNCSSCGKCYEKETDCATCGATIILLEKACPACGEPITEDMRDQARHAYMTRKQEEREKLFPGMKANREKRQKWLKTALKAVPMKMQSDAYDHTPE